MTDVAPLNATSRQTFPVFVSSLCRRAPGLEDLRAQIYHEVGRKTYVYVDEQFKHRDTERQDDLEAADELICRVREANTFICILGGSSHGSPIKVDGIPSSASFFEIELYQAALLQKKIHVFVRSDFTPEPRLGALLHILRDTFCEWRNIKRQTDSEILAGVKRVVDGTLGHPARRSWLALRAPIDRFVQALYAARARNRPAPSIFFLSGDTDPTRGKPRVEIIRPLVQDIERQRNEEKRLSRLWIGLRELMALNHQDLQDQELLGYWNRLLAEWARAGAWYGLHGDTPLGCLAALNSLTQVRSRIAMLFLATTESGDTAFPGGALASSKYSIAKRLYVKQDRLARFNEALSDLGRSLDIERGDISGLLAIRGSILRQIGRISDCIDDYEKVLGMRRERNAPPNEIGEALSELGYAYLRQFSPRRGLRLCEEGVEKLRQGGRPGFLARALRKLAVAYLINGRFVKAYETRQEARAAALNFGVLDQL
jgi:tetratricopeptide (TPR) repeat protein